MERTLLRSTSFLLRSRKLRRTGRRTSPRAGWRAVCGFIVKDRAGSTPIRAAAQLNVIKNKMIKIVILLGLLQLLRVTGKPILCSSIYAVLIFIFGLLFGGPFTDVLLFTAIGFILSTVYFYLLDMFSDSGFYWLILIVGLLIGLI